jgi:hypothetical protein
MKKALAAVAVVATGVGAFAVIPSAFAVTADPATVSMPTATVFPNTSTDTAVRNFKFTVTDPTPSASNVNEVKIFYPNNAGIYLPQGATLSAPSGWSATASKDTGPTPPATESVTFRATGTGPLAGLVPGQPTDFTVPALVSEPSGAGVSDTWKVIDSRNGGSSTAPTTPSIFTTGVSVLAFAGSLAPIAPQGVTDRTGTSGEPITYSFSVKNYASQPITVSPTFSSSSSSDSTSNPASASIPGDGASTAFTAPATLGTAGTSTFTASLPGAGSITDAFTVQAPSALVLGALSPSRVGSGAHTLSVASTKTGTPAVNVTSASLSIGSLTAAASAVPSFASGNQTTAQNFSFPVNISSTQLADGTYPASLTAAITDDNGFSYTRTLTPTNQLTIDTLGPTVPAPTITLPQDSNSVTQTETKNGDTLTIAGQIGSASAPAHDLDTSSLHVFLTPNAGPVQNATCANAPTETQAGSGVWNYSCTFSGSWAAQATSVAASAQVKDTAGNLSNISDGSNAVTIDNVPPTGATFASMADASKVVFFFTDNGDPKGFAGGCDPNDYQLNSTPASVTAVTADNGAPCTGRTTGVRILTLRNPVSNTDAPGAMTFMPTPFSSGTVTDGAGNKVVLNSSGQITETIKSVIPPQTPILGTVTRSSDGQGGTETAAQNGNTYYGRFAGNSAFQVTVTNAKQNYHVQVLDGSGNVLSDTVVTQSPGVGQSTVSYTANIPVPATDGTYVRSIRFVNGNGLKDQTDLTKTFVLDTVRPTFGFTPINSTSDPSATVTFSEPIAGGTDSANDWYVRENTANGPKTFNVDSVTPGTTAQSRVVHFTLDAGATFAGVLYQLDTTTTDTRYSDLAGNLIADSF